MSMDSVHNGLRTSLKPVLLTGLTDAMLTPYKELPFSPRERRGKGKLTKIINKNWLELITQEHTCNTYKSRTCGILTDLKEFKKLIFLSDFQLVDVFSDMEMGLHVCACRRPVCAHCRGHSSYDTPPCKSDK